LVPLAILSWPCPWRLCPLHRAGMARQVILLQVVVNFFWDQPLSWIRFLGWPRRLMARCRSPYCFFCAPTNRFHYGLFLRDLLMHRYRFHLPWICLHHFWIGLRHFLAGCRLFSPGIHAGSHPFMMGI
jgi:hypothetical protein